MDPFIGQIIMFGGDFAPRGWAKCDGQLLSIAQNSALFAILGTTYGGDGITTFALPDLRGRAPVHEGTGPGLSTYALGEATGVENVTLTVAEIPSHNHTAGNNANNSPPSTEKPQQGSLALSNIYSPDAPDFPIKSGPSGNTGGNQPHSNIQPVLAVNFIIALEGVFPSRS